MRARNIKPGFFRDAEILDLPLEARFLFVGLWCLADRQGKLEDKPKQIKVEVFGEKLDCDCHSLLDLLLNHGLIIRYSVDGAKYIKVINFLKHQSPHHTEAQSKLPDPPEIHGESTVTHGEPPETQVKIPPDSLNPDLLIKNPPTPKGGSASNEKTKKRGKRKDRVLPPFSSDFEKFWSAYPRRPGGRGGKEAAWRVWQRRVKNGSLPAIPDLMAALTKLVASEAWLKEDGRFIPMVSTFLNKGRWTDADDLGDKDQPACQIDPNCPHCHGLGFVEVERGGVKGQIACKCRSENHGS